MGKKSSIKKRRREALDIPAILVTGFPRTGTSTMMRMLLYGGIEVVADEALKKAQNEFDPYGSFELENVGQTLNDALPGDQEGKAIKVVTPYVSFIPLNRPFKVIFMLRDLTEIIASLAAMQVVWEHSPDESISYARYFFEQNNIPVHYVKYKEMVKYPRATAIGIKNFLGKEFKFNVDAAIKAVDPNARKKHKPFTAKLPGEEIKRPSIITFSRTINAVEEYDRTDLDIDDVVKAYEEGRLK